MAPKRSTDLRRIAAARADKKRTADPAREAERDSGPERDDGVDGSTTTDRQRDLSSLAPPDADLAADVPPALADAAARVLGDDEPPADPLGEASALLEAKAGREEGERARLRAEASQGLRDDAAAGDGVTGIAEQGSGSVRDVTTKEGRVEFMKGLLGGNKPAPGEEVERRTGDVDLSQVGTDALVKAKLIQSNLIRGDEMTKEVVKVTPGGTVIEQTPAGVRIASTPDGKVIRTEPDGTKSVTRADGSSTTVHPNGEVTETPPTKAPSTDQPDDEHTFDLDPAHGRLTGLDRFLDKIAPRPIEGGGHTDPPDDDPGFGSGAVGGAAGAVPDTQDLLLGGNTRGLDRSDGSGGSIDLDRALDPVRGGGDIDPTDDADVGFGGGGLEDDPLDGLGVADADLSDRPDTTVARDEPADEAGADDPLATPFLADLIDGPVFVDGLVDRLDVEIDESTTTTDDSGEEAT